MPDWSYRTLFRPLLFQLPSRIARNVTLRAMNTLSRMPWGIPLIRTLGHMESFPILESERWGISLQYPVGLSGTLDIHGVAAKAMSPFGFGFMEIGPVTIKPITSDMPIRRNIEKQGIVYPDLSVNDGLEVITARLNHQRNTTLPLMIRLRHMPGKKQSEALLELDYLIKHLAPFAAGFYIDSIDPLWRMDDTIIHLQTIVGLAKSLCESKPVFIYIPLDYEPLRLKQLICGMDMDSYDGVVIGDAIRTQRGYEIGASGKAASFTKVVSLRALFKDRMAIIATGGIHQPQDALDMINAGADLVQLHSGLVYSGPGLPKRINEAIIYERLQSVEAVQELPPQPRFWYSWGWMCFVGLAMILGGIMAWYIAVTRVVLPYDEEFLGLSRELLIEINQLLLPFMSHDRITLAGTMISIGVIYYQLARYGLRYGLHWPRTALMVSCLVGFSSFFLYFGFGYFDPLHALVAAILFPMFLLSMRSQGDRPSLRPVNRYNDRSWLFAQWGQLLFVILGAALAIGGATISFVGITHVFVSQDLDFLGTTSEHLAAHNERLVPLIAHDRAGFGGALFSEALAILAIALWGIQQGARWLWWTLFIGGMPGFIAVFGIHAVIGYSDFLHLLPAYFAFFIYILGLLLLYPYMVMNRVRGHNK